MTVFQPLHYRHHEPSHGCHHQPAAAPQLPLGAVSQPHGAGEGLPGALPAARAGAGGDAVGRRRRSAALNKVVDWLPEVWMHLNKFLETHSSTDVTIGPRLFLSCPMEVSAGQVGTSLLAKFSILYADKK